jgi:class 3 adenylate cyclase
LFLEAMLDRGAEVSIVLPYNQDEFVRDSVDFVPNSNWRSRFERVLARATSLVTASNQPLAIGGVSYDYANQMLLGLATIHSARLGAQLIPLAVWDGTRDAPGGTASAVDRWRKIGYTPTIIDLAQLRINRPFERRPRSHSVEMKSKMPRKRDFGSNILAILFADAVGFSKLSESEIPHFVEHFLGAIAKLIKQFRYSTLEKNTWGDGLYLIFSSVEHAGSFALDLAGLVANTDWAKYSLPAGLNLRIALHAGPVYEFDDPITGERCYGGTHVSRAARIEPITPAGQVYASEAFAALAAAQGVSDFACDYVGQTPMAKGYGTLPTYHVRRSAPVAARL